MRKIDLSRRVICPACHDHPGVPLDPRPKYGFLRYTCGTCGHIWKVPALQALPPPL